MFNSLLFWIKNPYLWLKGLNIRKENVMHGYSLSHLWHLASYAEATMLMSFLSKLTDSLYVQKSWEKNYICVYVCLCISSFVFHKM